MNYRALRFRESIFLLAIVLVLPVAAFSQEARPFEVLVVGDSHISGQGLKPQNKFYSLVAQWLQNEVLGKDRKLDLKVKAHAGSRIDIHREELADMIKAGDDVNKYYYDEANISSPSIRRQIDDAAAEYRDPKSVELVMLSGCITDVLVGDIVNPFYPEKKLRERIKRFCGGSMAALLRHVADKFPNAKIAVIGYFPIASKKGDVRTMVRYFSRIAGVPPKLQVVFTNPLSRPAMSLLRNRIARRSKIWVKDSDRYIQDAIAAVNKDLREKRAIFVASPIPESASYATKNSLLWEIGPDHVPNDETYAERKVGCASVFSEMKYQHYGKLSTLMCELSSVAHPNVEGSKAFSGAITTALKLNFFKGEPNLGNQ
jgi:hypothetical protein